MDDQVEHARRPARGPASSGPVSFMNPTIRYLPIRSDLLARPPTEKPAASGAQTPPPSQEAGYQGPYRVWRSRDSRKGRHGLAATRKQAKAMAFRATSTSGESAKGIGKMFVRYPIWDISYDVAMLFTVGSIVWVINGFFMWYPLENPDSAFPNESTTGGGVTALIGATIFELGASMMMLEALNEDRDDCFGWAIEEAVSESGAMSLRPSQDKCRHLRWGRWSNKGKGGGKSRRGTKVEASETEGGEGEEEPSWTWWPSWRELRSHYLKEIGFWACLIQMAGATIFWISGFVGLPPILNRLSLPASNGIYWLPQVVGGSGFIISGALFMLETQPKWYVPAPKMLGWQVGFWNMVGGIGFTLCGAFGFAISVESIQYVSSLSTFIGAWAFLIGSVVQWYESLDKYPIFTDSSLFRLS